VAVRYIGSKARIADVILDLIGEPRGDSVFADLFSGTGAVSEEAANRGWPIRLNDHLFAAVVMSRARLISREDVPFVELGGYEATLAQLADCSPQEGFMWREYSPASACFGETERRYFTESNAAKIDGCRLQLAQWYSSGTISEVELHLLLADLLRSVNSVANIAGTYGCFLSHWSPQAQRLLTLSPRTLRDAHVQLEVYCGDAKDVGTAPSDVVYLDPPYTKRQYAAYYHILETLAHGDAPAVIGKTGLRPWQHLASDYCYKRRALDALVDLIASIQSEAIYLSYSNEGHVAREDLVSRLASFSTVRIHELGDVGRYRPNATAAGNRSSVQEYVIEVRRGGERSLE
jgi:adenine-specific DNA-methyltransferase